MLVAYAYSQGLPFLSMLRRSQTVKAIAWQFSTFRLDLIMYNFHNVTNFGIINIVY